MVFNTLFAAVSAASLLLPAASAFDPQAKNNVAVYYGQGYNQKRLSHFCDDDSIDIINLGFLNVFPDQGLNGFPGTNFGNQCGPATFTIDGKPTQLLSNCHQLWQDIPKCQAAGKKVFLSLGGGRPKNQDIESPESAKDFAKFLWYAFGPPTDAWIESDGPRPFKDVTIDGFDFDVEYNDGSGYAIIANELRGYFAQKPDQQFYLSAAPRCGLPNKQLGDAIANAPFDFIWPQFYNDPECGAYNFIDILGTGFNYDAWADVIRNSANPSAKLLIGLPGDEESAVSSMYYMPPTEVIPLVAAYIHKYPEMFGGIMVWDATSSERNQNLRGSYADNMKWILDGFCPAPTTSSTPSSTPHTSTTPTSMPSSSPVTSSTLTSSSVTTSSSASPSSTVPTTSSTPTSSSAVTSSSASPTSTVPTTSSTPTSSSAVTSSSANPTSSSASPTGSSSSAKPTSSGSAKPTTSKSAHSSSHPSGSGSSSHLPTVVPTGTTSSFHVGRTSSTRKSKTPCSSKTSTGHQHSGTETPTVTSGITSAPGVSATGTTTAPETITTVIVTSYTSICPTGFTTITTTYTTTYCPATASATPTVTNGPTNVPAQTTAPPEGWTTTVTVCTHCAATPTTVTLTLPCETGTESPSGTPGNSSPGNGSPTGGSGIQPTTVPVIVPTQSSSRPVHSSGVGAVQPSKTMSVQPSGPNVVPTGPSSTQGGTSPVFTGGASRLQNGLAMALPLVAALLV